jgi:hypothetical protein
MTINPRPQQEALIQAALQAGLIQSAEDALDVGLDHLRERIAAPSKRPPGRKRLAQLFAESPLKGLGIDFERDPDAGRPADL